MQRIMQAQALGDSSKQAYMQGKKTMEINPRHPLIVGLLDKVQADEDDASAADTARLLFETALLESGYPMQDHQKFASRVRAPHTCTAAGSHRCVAALSKQFVLSIAGSATMERDHNDDLAHPSTTRPRSTHMPTKHKGG